MQRKIVVGFLVVGLVLVIRGCLNPSKRNGQERVGVVAKPKPTNGKKPKPIKKPERPKMPLQPLKKGVLDNVVVVLDPGHGGTDPGSHWSLTYHLKGKPVTQTHWEAAYTYRMVGELAQILRQRGATVYLTAWSTVMADRTEGTAQDPLPLPRDAGFYPNTKGVTVARWKTRVAAVNAVAKKYAGKRARLFSVSIHIDAMNNNWTGGHVCVRQNVAPPRVAQTIADEFITRKVARRKKGVLTRPIDQHRSLYMVRKVQISEAVLVEMGIPQNARDSWRLRHGPRRRELLGYIANGIAKAAR